MNDLIDGCRTLAEATEQGYSPPGVPAMLKDAATELTRLRAQQTVLTELRRLLQRLIDVDDADKSGKGLVSAQGQGMDGYTKLANYERCVEKARKALATLDVPPEKS